MPIDDADATDPSGPGRAAGQARDGLELVDVALGLGPLALGTIVGLLTNARGQPWWIGAAPADDFVMKTRSDRHSSGRCLGVGC